MDGNRAGEGRAPVRHGTAGKGPLRWGCLLAAGLTGLSLGGCALSWDEVTSRDFHVKDVFSKPDDPLTVLHDSKDGDKRAHAFRALQEPKFHGGSDHDQDFVLEVLAEASRSESRYWTRLEAVRKLGEFKDPRAAPALIEAYYKADTLLTNDRSADPNQAKELISTFRCEVLAGLGKIGNPAAVTFLAKRVSEPSAVGPENDMRRALDERIAAARALKSFPQYQSTEALLSVLKTEKDVALRDCAAESLQACTGKKLPADYAAWDDFLHHQEGTNKDEGIAAGKKKGFMELILTGFGGKP
jgi:hypothetical protein